MTNLELILIAYIQIFVDFFLFRIGCHCHVFGYITFVLLFIFFVYLFNVLK
jgi:hypothetical protein